MMIVEEIGKARGQRIIILRLSLSFQTDENCQTFWRGRKKARKYRSITHRVARSRAFKARFWASLCESLFRKILLQCVMLPELQVHSVSYPWSRIMNLRSCKLGYTILTVYACIFESLSNQMPANEWTIKYNEVHTQRHVKQGSTKQYRAKVLQIHHTPIINILSLFLLRNINNVQNNATYPA